ncbi:hypothetical protein [Sporisorium scitamineum]|uniref:Uncharacterized protein n=1 Tax=Sporisorium scitamineum TaxID=49012 RepID=A0A0F7S4W1_9BASI|nr:hypothetical protein [Sporisorium scitamineum]
MPNGKVVTQSGVGLRVRVSFDKLPLWNDDTMMQTEL